MQRMILGVGAMVSVSLLMACRASDEQGEGGSQPQASSTTAGAPTADAGAAFRSSWPDTDFSIRTVDLSEVINGGVPIDGIPPLDAEGAVSIPGVRSGDANFLPAEELDYQSQLPVAFITWEDEAVAYPLHILTLHEIVNDIVGETPVAMTFCPLCNTVLAFDRRVGGEVLDFGVSGLLRHSDLIMWDRQTKSWWQQATGEGIVGQHAGVQLRILPARILSFGEVLASYPDARVLTEETNSGRTYGRNPYVGYDRIGNTPFLFRGEADERLPAMERVVALGGANGGVAVPFSILRESPVAHLSIDGYDVVVFWAAGTTSALDQASIADSEDIGAAAAYSPVLDDRVMSFEPAQLGQFRDLETGSTWTVAGVAIDGPLEGAELEVVPHTNIFWFAWAAFAPKTEIWTE